MNAPPRVVGRWLVVAALATALGACGDDDVAPAATCETAALQSALAGAAPGASVAIGACEITGTFTIPPGVAMVGAGVGATVLRGDGGAPVVDLAAGASLRGVSVIVPSGTGIRARGAGVFEVREVALDVARGIGLAARDASSITLSAVRITGPVTSDNARTIGSPGDAAETGTFGILAYDVQGEAATDGLFLSDVEVRGFATAGIALVRSKLTWDAGDPSIPEVLEGNRGHGLMLFGGVAELRSVRACGTLSAAGLPGLTIAASEGASLVTDAMLVCDGDGFGVFQDASTAVHTGLEVRGLSQAGVWAQATGQLSIGAGSVLEDDGVAGVAAIDVERVTIEGTRIEAIREAPIPDGGAGAERMGDGLHAVRTSLSAPPLSVELDDVRFIDNVRVGALLDGFDERATLSLRAVTVRGSGDELGALAQRIVELPDGWDAEVVREGDTLANDAAFESLRRVLEVSGIIMPPAAPLLLD